jgi:hypothetical protein
LSLLVVSALTGAAFMGGEVVPAAAKPPVDPSILFPSGTVLMLSIDGAPCVAHSKELAISKIWHEPEVQAFLKDAVDMLNEQLSTNNKQFAKGLGLEPKDLENLAQARLAIAMTKFELPEGGFEAGEPKVDLMLAMELRGNQKAVEGLMKMAEAAIAGGNEAAVKDATVGGVPGRALAVPGGGPFETVTYLFHEGWLLAGTSTAQLEAAMARAKSGEKKDSLASNDFFAASMKEVARPKTVASFYMDYGAYFDIISSTDETMKEVLGASGAGAMKALAFGMDLDGSSIRERFFAAMAPNSPMDKLMAPIDPSMMLSKVPKRSLAAWLGSINLKGTVDYFVKMMSQIPMAGDMVEQGLEEVDKFLGKGWREDLLGNLGPDWAFFVAAAPHGVVPEVGIMVKVGDRAKVEAAIAKSVAHPEMKDCARSVAYGDATIHYLDLGELEIDRDFNMRPAWTFVDGCLLLAATPHHVKSLLTSMAQKDGGLLAREDFAKTFGRLKGESQNAGNLGVGYVDAQWLGALVLDSVIPIIQSAVPPRELKQIPVKLDLAKIPSTQSITKHLSAFLMQSQTKEGGTYSEIVSPTGVIGGLAVGGAAVGLAFTLRSAEAAAAEIEPSERDGRMRVRPKKDDEKEKDEDKDK